MTTNKFFFAVQFNADGSETVVGKFTDYAAAVRAANSAGNAYATSVARTNPPKH